MYYTVINTESKVSGNVYKDLFIFEEDEKAEALKFLQERKKFNYSLLRENWILKQQLEYFD